MAFYVFEAGLVGRLKNARQVPAKGAERTVVHTGWTLRCLFVLDPRRFDARPSGCAREVNIKNLIDDAKCYDTFRALRWPDGVRCDHCHSAAVTKQGRDTTQPERQIDLYPDATGSRAPVRTLPGGWRPAGRRAADRRSRC